MSSTLFTPYKLGPVTLRNRTIRSAAFESMGKDFGPTRQLKDYHVAVARGGVGMTTLAYAAVCRSGLSFNKQLWLRPEIVPGLREITDAVHREGAAAAIQIGHCGNMTHWTTAGQMPIGASTGFNLYAYTPVRGMKRREIEQVARDFGTAVRTARDAGFDSVEVHAGHGYLISQFLSPYTNHRHDEYGGSLDNRMRFMRMCLEEVMNAADATGTSVLVKHNMYDGFKGGIEIPESIEIAREIERDETHFKPMIDMDMVSVNHEITAQLARSAVRASTNLPIKYVVLDTKTGRTGRYLAAFRGRCQVLAVCYTRHAQRILALSYGVVPILREQQSHERYQDRYHFVIDALDFIQRKHAIEPTDLLAVVGGSFDSKYGASYLEISSAERFRERDAVCDGC